jgi:hypothetical protein
MHFNKLIDGVLSTEDFPADLEFVATHVQHDEINSTCNDERKAKLLQKFSTLVDYVVPTESMVFGVSRWGQAKLSDGTLYNKLKHDLDTMNAEKDNNSKDALIAEVAIHNHYELFTADSDLAQVARKHGAQVRYFST